MVQWLRLHALSAGGTGPIPGQELRSCMPYGTPPAPQKKEKKEKQLLEEDIGSKLLDISLGNDFLDLTPKPKASKAKINKWDYTKV